MKELRFAPVVAPLLALVLTGCGLTSSPADALTFRPPSGWHSSPGIMGFMQFWKPAGSRNEVLMLFKSPKPLQPKEIFDNAQMRNATIEQRRQIKICGNHSAQYMRAKGSRQGGDDDVQMVAANFNGSTYFALYVYPIGVTPNAQAVAAIRELCPKT